jgi:hypothetical protein
MMSECLWDEQASRPRTFLMSVRGLPLNISIDTDPQQQEAASPLMLVVRSSLR